MTAFPTDLRGQIGPISARTSRGKEASEDTINILSPLNHLRHILLLYFFAPFYGYNFGNYSDQKVM